MRRCLMRRPKRVMACQGRHSMTLRRSAATRAEPGSPAARFVEAVRHHGHKWAHYNPLGPAPSRSDPALQASSYGLGRRRWDCSNVVWPATADAASMTPKELEAHLHDAYCGPLSVQLGHLEDDERATWLAQRVEQVLGQAPDDATRVQAWELMMQSEQWDHFLQLRFRSVKRYGLEGAEAFMPGMHAVLQEAREAGIGDVVLGMAHRGRLNLLAGLLRFPLAQIFHKMAGGSEVPARYEGTGDVLSHLSVRSRISREGPTVTMLHNPSHLESVNPAVMGRAWAKQARHRASEAASSTVLPLLIHGDAAFAGQGIIYEGLQMTRLPDFRVGGTVHITLNNQLGFTTDPSHGRSTRYATDVVKAFDIPVIRVNAEFPEHVMAALRLAVQYRQRWADDVMVDLVGYRRHGHNEMDEPGFTQPSMYENIRARPSIVTTYGDTLESGGVLDAAVRAQRVQATRDLLQAHHKKATGYEPTLTHVEPHWRPFLARRDAVDMLRPVPTGLPAATLRHVAEASVQVPDVVVHPRLMKTFCDPRQAAMHQGQGVDWATAEACALGSLLLEGQSVRMCGQDVGRGTFSHRHFSFTCQSTQKRVCPLVHMQPLSQGSQDVGTLHVVNSPLSEASVLAFEYGVSTEHPDTFVIWEAQFGDFHNCAQVILDTFVSAGEDKWNRPTALTLLLPHGYDGAGPEHSSARIERFLQMCNSVASKSAQDHSVNMTVINATTPANYFHALRRQMLRPIRRPMVVISPKTLLRHRMATSSLDDMGPETHFLPVLADAHSSVDPSAVTTIALCSGKAYYDLVAERSDRGANNIVFIRLEELCPFPRDAVREALARYTQATEVLWVQEEPENMGAWTFAQPRLDTGSLPLRAVCPAPLSSPAVGIGTLHKSLRKQWLDQVFANL